MMTISRICTLTLLRLEAPKFACVGDVPDVIIQIKFDVDRSGVFDP